MAQNQPSGISKQRLLLLLALYIPLTFFMWQNWNRPRQEDAGKGQAISQVAAERAKEGRSGEMVGTDGAKTQLDRAERVKRLEEAIKKYDEIWKANPATPEGIQARFEPINIYDFLVHFEGERSGTHWYDQAELRLKEMQSQFHNKTGSVEIEQNGVREKREGNLEEIATSSLNSIRAARDEFNKSKITYKILDALVNATGRVPNFSYWFALALIVVVLKTLTYPLQKKQHLSMLDMARLQPLMKQLQEEMKDRPPAEMNQRMMQLYRENNVNMFAGCLPMLVLSLVLLPVFWMIRDYEYQFTHGTLLWIGSAASQSQWWLAKNLAQFDVPMFVIYIASTIIFSLMQPKPVDPQQAQQQRMMMVMMPLMFGWFMWTGKWSSAFMFYWLVLNLVSMYQSWLLKKRYGTATSQPAPSSGGGSNDGGGVITVSSPLNTMKGVHTPKSNGKKKRRQGPGGMLGGQERP